MPTPLPDAANRDIIQNDIDTNLVVEAAAGTGKTTCLVGRLMTLFRRGALAGESRLAAVTFTHKAAAELRERLEKRLAETLADAGDLDPDERQNLQAAAAALPECHIGTIHSFCARIIRERPVEAGVGPDFSELDDSADELLRRRAWAEFAAEMRRGAHRDLYSVFEIFGVDQAELEEGFVTFSEYPDVAAWPGARPDPQDIDPSAFVRGVEQFHAALAVPAATLADAEAGNDQLIPLFQVLERRLRRLARPIGLADAYRLSGLFREHPKTIQKQWAPLGLDKDAVKDLADQYALFYERTVKPFRHGCLAGIYHAALAAFAGAREVYDRLRREQLVLNFQDLLMIAARMLRDFPAVRADLAERYARLLVDEVQDTDPVQAEIMFLLAADNAETADWRRTRPRPGSLFIVGDPKQSIYRFRRADIVVYQEVKDLIAKNGGRLLDLSANFRSQPAIIEWVNRTFGPRASDGGAGAEAAIASGRFGGEESKYGPAYIPLEPALAAPAGCFSGVFALETLKVDKKAGIGDAEVFLDEAVRIARFIRHAVDTGLSLPDRNGGAKPARPGDFLIVTYKKASSGLYADALRRLALPCIVSSGGTLRDSRILGLALCHLRALAEPDNPVLLAALLRSGLFGVSDADLYRWKRAGGEFSFLAAPPEVGGSPLPDILRRLAEHFRLFRRHQPVRAFEMIADDLGLWAHSCLGDDPATAAGALAAACELLESETIPTAGKLAERLAWLMDNHEEDTLPARPRQADAVRVMNLHKTKGLEAPVVFLACTRGVRAFPPSFAIRRDGGAVTGGLAIRCGEFRERPLTQPFGWEPMAEEEQVFLAAEKIRLNYVAATRAGAALVVSVHQSDKTWQSRFLPEYTPGHTIVGALPEPEGTITAPPAPAAEAFDAGLPARFAAGRQARIERVLAPTYRTARAKPEQDWRMGAGEGASDLSPDEALRLGETLHSLLEFPRRGETLRAAAAELLRDYELPVAMTEEISLMAESVWRSSIWQRAIQSNRMFREAPYTRRRISDGLETVERGVIDLVFREASGWVIVDYKSDHLEPGADRAHAAQRHAGQLANYAEAWREITGEQVEETGIYFLRTGEYVRLERELTSSPAPARTSPSGSGSDPSGTGGS